MIPEDYAEELEADASIDPERLDVELVRQSGPNYSKWGRRVIEAQFVLDKAEAQFERTEDKLELLIREDPEAFRVTSPTERSVKAAVRLHPDYVEAQAIVLEAKRQLSSLKHAVSRMDKRDRALFCLVELYKGEYFAGPSIPRDLVAKWKEYQSGNSPYTNPRERAVARARGQRRGDSNNEPRVRRTA